MEPRFQALPPLKRLRLMQKQEQKKQESNGSAVESSQLPAKKRKKSRLGYVAKENTVANYCLPAKKRVWAIDPEMLSGKPLSPFDLNLEYNSSFVDEKKRKKGDEESPGGKYCNGMIKPGLEGEGEENIDPLGRETEKSYKRQTKKACEDAVTTYCLPAKKRVWAIDPEMLSGMPLSPFDLNLEYNSSFEDKKKGKKEEVANPVVKNRNVMIESSFKENKENIDPLVRESKKSYQGQMNEASSKNPVTTYCLPAKKRVWAIDPDMLSGNPLSAFDLNLECNSSFEAEKIGKNRDLENSAVKSRNGIELSSDIEDRETMDSLARESKKTHEREMKQKASENEENKEVYDDDDDDIDGDGDDDGIICAVCQSTDGDPSDPIVLCDGCDLMVHATCYGNPLINGIPEGDWFCSQCLENRNEDDKTVSCCLCPVKTGAMKPTNDGLWAHIVCSLFVPEVFFEDPEGKEGINCSQVPKRRWRERCYVCKSRRGCVIECSEPKCPLSFHVTCGLKEDLCVEYQEGKKKGAIVAGFCKDHTKLWEKQQQTGKFKIVARHE